VRSFLLTTSIPLDSFASAVGLIDPGPKCIPSLAPYLVALTELPHLRAHNVDEIKIVLAEIGNLKLRDEEKAVELYVHPFSLHPSFLSSLEDMRIRGPELYAVAQDGAVL
jgi:hypothetical protein